MELFQTLIGVVGTLAGVWIGHRFGKHDALEAEERAQLRQRKAVLRVLHTELNRNLDSLEKLREKVFMNLSGRGSPADMASSFSNNVAGLAELKWEDELFKSQISALGLSLDAEEIGQYMNFYSGVRELSERLTRLGDGYRRINASPENQPTLKDRIERDLKWARERIEELQKLGSELHSKEN